MDLATEICPLTQEAVADLLSRRMDRDRTKSDCRRKAQRWSFPGTVELWVPGSDGERYELATSINLSTTGIGIRVDEHLPPGTIVGIAVHEPEASFHGKAVVRHCTPTDRGYHLAGLEFFFS